MALFKDPIAARVYLGGIAAQLAAIGIARFAFTPLLPVMLDQSPLSTAGGGLLGAMIYAGYLSGTLVLVMLRRAGLRYAVFVAGLVLAVLSTAMMAVSDALWLWALSRFFGGFAGVAGMLLAAEFILIWLRDTGRRQDLGPHYLGLGLGIALSGVVSALMGPDLPWPEQWLIFAALACLIAPLSWACMPRPAKAPPAPADLRAKGSGRAWFWLFGLGYACAGWGYAVGATFSVDILTRSGTGLSPQAVWVLLGLACAGGAVTGSRLAQRFGVHRVLVGAMAVQVATLAGYGGSWAVLLLPSAVLFGASFVMIVSLSLTLAGQAFPEAPGAAMARMTLLYGTGQILGPMVAGRLTDAAGTYWPALILSALVVALGLGFMALAERVLRREG